MEYIRSVNEESDLRVFGALKEEADAAMDHLWDVRTPAAYKAAVAAQKQLSDFAITTITSCHAEIMKWSLDNAENLARNATLTRRAVEARKILDGTADGEERRSATFGKGKGNIGSGKGKATRAPF